MLLKITNQCVMACTHCMEDSRPNTAQHMTEETFRAALDCAERVEGLARQVTGYDLLLFSGGECTEHPQILHFLDLALERAFKPLLITNGLWIGGPLEGEILSRAFSVQVTNDPRFYPRQPVMLNHSKVTYVNSLTLGQRLGRGERLKDWKNLPARAAPGSFNFRSLTRSLGDVRKALVMLRASALGGKSGHCTPTISHDGSFVAGESRLCARVGDVHSSPEELTEGVLRMGACDRCGLESKLDSHYRAALGLT